MPSLDLGEPIIRIPDTLGAGAGTTLPQAIYRGICELIERDAFALCYYTKLPGKRIDFSSIKDKKIIELVSYVRRYKLEPIIFDISGDMKIPTFLSLIFDNTGIGPRVVSGCRTDLSWQNALTGSLIEGFQSLLSLREILTIGKSIHKKNYNKSVMVNRPNLKRLLFWAQTDAKKHLGFLLDNQKKERVNFEQCNMNTYEEKLTYIIAILRQKKVQMYWKEVTPHKLHKYHLYSVRTISPDLIPLSIDENHPYLGSKRLTEFKKKGLNTIIHPLS